MEGYGEETRRLDALYEAMQLVLREFEDTRDAGVAAAGHVIAQMFIERVKAMDEGLDKPVAAQQEKDKSGCESPLL